jgi:hypothetical protein
VPSGEFANKVFKDYSLMFLINCETSIKARPNMGINRRWIVKAHLAQNLPQAPTTAEFARGKWSTARRVIRMKLLAG